jgi:hypothetical protein
VFGLYVGSIGIGRLSDRAIFIVALVSGAGVLLSIACAFALGQSVPLNRRPENVRILAAIIAEFELGEMQRHALTS